MRGKPRPILLHYNAFLEMLSCSICCALLSVVSTEVAVHMQGGSPPPPRLQRAGLAHYPDGQWAGKTRLPEL